MTFNYPSSRDRWQFDHPIKTWIDVTENREEIELDILDQFGQKVRVSPKKAQIGFVHFD